MFDIDVCRILLNLIDERVRLWRRKGKRYNQSNFEAMQGGGLKILWGGIWFVRRSYGLGGRRWR